MKNKKYFLGLDIGTDSVGYAVTDTTENYNLLKFKGEPMWGVTLFDEANLSADRRTHRAERRRIDRRQQRVTLMQELFSKVIYDVDPFFYKRISESALLREDAEEPYCIFNGNGYTDKEYHKQYPTIHHLIVDLMKNDKPHDPRLVYLACAWLIAHRGNFLSDVAIENVSSVLNFKPLYNDLMQYCSDYATEKSYLKPWSIEEDNIDKIGEVLKHNGITKKVNELQNLLNDGKKFKKVLAEEDGEFPFGIEGIIKLLCGGSYALAELFRNEEYKELGSITLDKDEEELEAVFNTLGDDAALIIKLKKIYDWSVLCEILRGENYISEAKKEIYEQHKKDLTYLKRLIKNNYPNTVYNKIFRKIEPNNYAAYSGKVNKNDVNIKNYKKCNNTDFCEFLTKTLELKTNEKIKSKIDQDVYDRILNGTFLPKQVNTDNRVIPYQLYYVELKKILDNAANYIPFINDKDQDGYTGKEKILSIMSFRIPYYVGPLNKNNNEHAWIVRKAEGKIYPWNFEKIVDLDACNEEFIKRMTNKCTYIAGANVLPKNSLLYKEFEVLNEINCLKINGQPIDNKAKQNIFKDLFMTKKKVTPKSIKEYLIRENLYTEQDAENLSGIDSDIKSSLSSYHAFSNLLSRGELTENEVEDIIKRRTYTEDNLRFKKWLDTIYEKLGETDRKYICKIKISEFGRLSKELLDGIKGSSVDIETGEIKGENKTVIEFMRDANVTLSELLLSDKYTFGKAVTEYNEEYYGKEENKLSFDNRLNEMYISNAVKRPIIRTFAVVNDIVKATGHTPEKIFVEMARGTKEDLKGKRTKSRKQQLIELYNEVKDTDIREIYEMLKNETDNRLQSDKLFLYYTQLGKCMYTGNSINVETLMGDNQLYNIDHIYPQAKVKDDSILNNKVLVLSEINGRKKDVYPIEKSIRDSMRTYWDSLKTKKLITEEKYNRLVRFSPFTEDEEWGFISRQLVETRQSTKAIAELLKEKYPDTDIVYVKAGLASDFRQEYNLLKSRAVNDLHHAKDAYLNIVCGNVYNEHFTKQWFLSNRNNYTVNMLRLLEKPIKTGTKTIWNGKESITNVKKNMLKNNCHLTFYPIMKKHGQKGGFFAQNPITAGSGTFPRKKGLDTSKYGGYNGLTTSFSVIVRYSLGKKEITEFVPVTLLCAKKFLTDQDYAVNTYIKSHIEEKATNIRLLFNGRPIKIGTEFDFDGLRVILAGQGSSDTRLNFKTFTPILLSYSDEQYVKAIESFINKTNNNSGLVYSEKFDKVNKTDNIRIYDILTDKMNGKPYSLRPENQAEKLKSGRNQFTNLDVKEQCKVILNILSHFNRTSFSDKTIRLTPNARLHSNISNWKYTSASIIDKSASGIWEKKSENLIKIR